ncbi:MAG: Ig-like domain-containing protein [Bacteroidota bacterium]
MPAGGVWSSNNEAIATVDINGLVTAVSPGTATINYAVTNACRYYYCIHYCDS